MIMDGIVLAVFALAIFLSMRKGFAITVAHFFQGIASLVIAWFFCDDLSKYIYAKTDFGNLATSRLQNHLSTKWESSELYKALPQLLKKSGDNDLSSTLISEGSVKLSNGLMTILSFVLIVLALRLLLALFIKIFSHREKEIKGFTGIMDWLLGGILGMVVGAVAVFVFLAFLPPLVGIIMPAKTEMIMGWFDGSYFAKDLYDSNLILVLFRDFLV